MKKLRFKRRGSSPHWVGDGFPVRTVFSYDDVAADLSPFLLLDYGGPARFDPTDARRGVGAHPHRGFETVTIVYAGEVDHRDSAGGGGHIGPGDVQWMTAGAGIVHEEYHGADYARRGGDFEMIQLWVNLPAKDKMTPPAYQTLTDARIPRVALPGEAGTARIIAGRYGEHAGPAHTFTPVQLWDLRLETGRPLDLEFVPDHTAALFVLRGSLKAGEATVGAAELAVFEREGDRLRVEAAEAATVLLLSGAPLNEPIVGYGPFVMNRESEIVQAFDDFRHGRMGQIAARGA